jgi:hypothetical protein
MADPKVASPASQSFYSCPFVELRNSLPSHVDIVSPFVDQLMHFIARFRGADGNSFEIELALREALVNAIIHGNQEDPHNVTSGLKGSQFQRDKRLPGLLAPSARRQ